MALAAASGVSLLGVLGADGENTGLVWALAAVHVATALHAAIDPARGAGQVVAGAALAWLVLAGPGGAALAALVVAGVVLTSELLGAAGEHAVVTARPTRPGVEHAARAAAVALAIAIAVGLASGLPGPAGTAGVVVAGLAAALTAALLSR